MNERDVERFRRTMRDWWDWENPRLPFIPEITNPDDKSFQWHRDSILNKKHRYKLDKKEIKTIMDDEIKEVTLGYRPIPKCVLRNVLGLDVDDSSFSNVDIKSRHARKHGSPQSNATAAEKRASIEKWLDELEEALDRDFPETRDEQASPGSTFEKRRTSFPFESASPFPWRISTPRRRKSSPSPCRRRASSPCPRTTSSPCPEKSSSPCPRRSDSPPYARRTPPSRPGRTSMSPCPRSTTPVFDAESNIYSNDAEFASEITERIGDPYGPRELVEAAISLWKKAANILSHNVVIEELPGQEHTPASKGGPSFKHSSPCGPEGFFEPGEPLSSESWGEPIEDDTYPDVTEPEQDFADEMAQFEAQTGAGWKDKSESSLDFENVKELSFVDQFLLPTANIEFDEAAQEEANPFGGYDDSNDCVAPPEIIQRSFEAPPIYYCSQKIFFSYFKLLLLIK
nr:uncharacterized protein LOC106689001 [Halyomorpha halys]